MKGVGSKNAWVLFLLILSGLVLGSFLGYITESVSGLNWLTYGQTFGLNKPLVLDIGLMVITFGLKINITIGSIIGVILALFLYRKL